MEFFLLVFLFVLLLFLVQIKKKKKDQYVEGVKLPPGPWQLPIIGNLHLLLFNLPHRVLSDLAAKHGPLIHLRVGEISLVMASSPEAARDIFKTHDHAFSDRPLTTALLDITYEGKDLIFSPYGDHWRGLRKTCVVELFSLKRVLSFRPIREHETRRLVTSIYTASPAPVNLSRMIRDTANDIIARATVGDHCKDKDILFPIFNQASKALSSVSIADIFPSSPLLRRLSDLRNHHKETRNKMDRVFDRVIHDRRERTAGSGDGEEENLLDVLLKIHDQGGGITAESIKGVIFDVFAAGSRTTSKAIDWAMSELARNPRVMQIAQAEVKRAMKEKSKLPMTEEDIKGLSYLRAAVKETLRLHPPLPLLAPRECRDSCRMLGYDVPKKARVLVNAWAIGKDPRYWENPLEFRPERFLGDHVKEYKGNDFEFLPFGGGRRVCPGITYAIITIEIILAQLLYYFDWKLPAGGRPEDLDMAEGSSGRRKHDLLLCPIPRVPCPLH